MNYRSNSLRLYEQISSYGQNMTEEQKDAFEDFFRWDELLGVTSRITLLENIKEMPPYFDHVEEFSVSKEEVGEYRVIVYQPYIDNIDLDENDSDALLHEILEWEKRNGLEDYWVGIDTDSWYDTEKCLTITIEEK